MLIQLNQFSLRLAVKILVHSYYYKTSPESSMKKQTDCFMKNYKLYDL